MKKNLLFILLGLSIFQTIGMELDSYKSQAQEIDHLSRIPMEIFINHIAVIFALEGTAKIRHIILSLPDSFDDEPEYFTTHSNFVNLSRVNKKFNALLNASNVISVFVKCISKTKKIQEIEAASTLRLLPGARRWMLEYLKASREYVLYVCVRQIATTLGELANVDLNVLLKSFETRKSYRTNRGFVLKLWPNHQGIITPWGSLYFSFDNYKQYISDPNKISNVRGLILGEKWFCKESPVYWFLPIQKIEGNYLLPTPTTIDTPSLTNALNGECCETIWRIMTEEYEKGLSSN